MWKWREKRHTRLCNNAFFYAYINVKTVKKKKKKREIQKGGRRDGWTALDFRAAVVVSSQKI